MNIKPIFDRVLAQEIKISNQTESGILDISTQNTVKKAVVLKTGEGCFEDGNFIKMQVNDNQIIYFEEHCAVKIVIQGKEYYLLKQTDILAVE